MSNEVQCALSRGAINHPREGACLDPPVPWNKPLAALTTNADIPHCEAHSDRLGSNRSWSLAPNRTVGRHLARIVMSPDAGAVPRNQAARLMVGISARDSSTEPSSSLAARSAASVAMPISKKTA